MNNIKRTVSIIIALLFCLSALTAAACSKPGPTPIATGSPDSVPTSSSGNNHSGSSASRNDGRDGSGSNTTINEHYWSALRDTPVLTIVYNGKEEMLTAEQLDQMNPIRITAFDPSAASSKNGDNVTFEGVTMGSLFGGYGVGDKNPRSLVLITASGERLELTSRLSAILFKRCVFALSSDKNIFSADRLGCFIVMEQNGNSGVESYGVVRIEVNFD